MLVIMMAISIGLVSFAVGYRFAVLTTSHPASAPVSQPPISAPSSPAGCGIEWHTPGNAPTGVVIVWTGEGNYPHMMNGVRSVQFLGVDK